MSNSQVNCILEDAFGFLWVGTLSGLNRYDGYSYQTFFHDANDAHSIANNTIMWLANGPDSTLWIGTGQGLSIYDPRIDRFIDVQPWLDRLQVNQVDIQEVLTKEGVTWFRIAGRGLIKYTEDSSMLQVLSTDPNSHVVLTADQVSDMMLDKDGNLWVLYLNGAVDVIDTRMDQVVRKFDFGSYTQESAFFSFYVDQDLDLWIYSSDGQLGLIYVNTTEGQVIVLNEQTLSSNIVQQVIQDGKGYIWVGTDHGGITVVDKATWETKKLKYEANNPGSLGNNSITSLFRSSNGIIWVGKSRKGLSYFNEHAGKFTHYKYPSDDPAYNDMLSIAENEEGDFWIGTNGQGLLKMDNQTKKMTPSNVLRSGQIEKVPDVIVSMYYARDHSLWIGTYTKGLYRYKEGELSSYRMGKENALSDDNIWTIFEDSKDNIWVGTLQAGIDKINVSTGQFTHYGQRDGLPVNYVTSLLEDDQNRVWIATGLGLSVFDPDREEFKNYQLSDTVDHSISSNSVVTIYNDTKGNLWVGTLNGLNRYMPEVDGFRVYDKRDGLASNIVMAIVEDDEGYLWISSDKGLSKLTVEEDNITVQSFSVSDGLQGNYYNERACLKTSTGMLAFAGQNGINMFDPKHIVVNDNPPNLVFTNFYLHSQLVKSGQIIENDVLLTSNLNVMKTLTLDYDQNSFGFEFAALTYDQAQSNSYEYKLEGFDQNWMKVSPEIRRASYTNINPGKYQLRVRASNSHNVWSDEDLKMTIIIRPPFWRTAWAYVGYFALLLLVMFVTRRLIVSREREKAKIENDRLDAQRLHELDLMKLKFFTNISHEFRTPISLVLTPIERMIKNPTNIREADFHVIQRNAKRLLTLVNQLLDFRKMEANQHTLHYSSGDLVKFVQDVIDSFSDLSKENEIHLSFESDLSQFYCSFDKDKMDKILFNLLSNAFKFTLEGGKIVVALEQNDKGHIVVSVADTGIGIPLDKQEAVFERFIQSEIKPNMINSGTGIGLSITKEFVELHGGTISVESEKDHGSTFFVEFPFKQLDQARIESEEEENQPREKTKHVEEEFEDKKKPHVFLVEDNADFRFYIKDNLKQHFNVSESFNGKEAWKSIVTQHPDMVISDVMMPVMNGLDLCKKIKNDPRTANIPVILLTAQTSEEHKIQGLEAGAIECISKPVNFEILVSTISSALKFQKRVNESSQRLTAEPDKIEVVSRDEKLVKDALELVEKNMSNSEFGVEELSHELGFSRGYLYQKMLKITGETPMDFIRNIRIKRAAELLSKSQMTVSEVAYAVGYNNPKLFSRYFKSVYKKYPSQYTAED
ncbi:hypothetical protein BFP72_10360 [Reichenbachiella sp. 5M10]|nr:hypothetical protein BFP72_10360 [Reichenbachiella sp. 5M10]